MKQEDDIIHSFVKSDELKRVQAVELDLLKHFLDFCQQYNLKVWADSGTLLGAVRHKGFIPWDDDIDLAMPRKDYDRMLALAPSYFKEPYFLQCAYSDPFYALPHAQLRNSQTTAIRPADCFAPYNQGIFIDIFVFDYVPANKTECKELFKKIRRSHSLLKAYNTPILATGRIGLIAKKIKAKRMVKKEGFARIYQKTEDEMRSLNPDQCLHMNAFTYSGDRFLFPKDLFDEIQWTDFEDTKIPVVKDYSTYLRFQFGPNYMLPLMNPNRHGKLFFDTENSYTKHLEHVRKKFKKEKFTRLFQKLTKK